MEDYQFENQTFNSKIYGVYTDFFVGLSDFDIIWA